MGDEVVKRLVFGLADVSREAWASRAGRPDFTAVDVAHAVPCTGRLTDPRPTHTINSAIGLPWSTIGVGRPLKSLIRTFEPSMPRWW